MNEKKIDTLLELFKTKVELFNLSDIRKLDTNNLLNELIDTGIYAIKNLKPFDTVLKTKSEYSLIIGFRPSVFHCGHLTLVNEVAWHLKNNARPIFVLSNDGSNVTNLDGSKKYVERFYEIMRALCNTQPLHEPIIYDTVHSVEMRQIDRDVLTHLKLGSLMKLYGFNEKTEMRMLMGALSMVSTSYVGNYVNPTIDSVMSVDINQVAHCELSLKLSRKLNIQCPSFLFRDLLPSLKGYDKRMSVKDKASAVFLNDSVDVIKKKILKSFTGGRQVASEQLKFGGTPLSCSFYRLVELFVSKNIKDNILQKCISGATLCGKCKEDWGHYIYNSPVFKKSNIDYM